MRIARRTNGVKVTYTTPQHNHFMAFFPGSPGWARARRELDFMVQGKINRGRRQSGWAPLHPD